MAINRAKVNIAAMRYRFNQKIGLPRHFRKKKQLDALERGRETLTRRRIEKGGEL